MIGNLSRRERTLDVQQAQPGAVADPELHPSRLRQQQEERVVEREQVGDELRRPVEVEQPAPELARRLRRRRDRLDDRHAERFLTSATPAVAASELQKLVKDMAAEAKTEVRSERILPPAERGEILEIPVEIAVSCEIRQLVDLLAKLDSAPKLLPVQDLKIRVVNVSQPKDLLVTLTVSGFILPTAQGKART